jgi:hypothetical protein
LIPSRIFPLPFLLLLRRAKFFDSLPFAAVRSAFYHPLQSGDCEGNEEAVGEG